MRLSPLFRLSVECLETRETPAVLYVDPTGSDLNTGTSSAPLLTLQTAANRVAAGDTVYVGAGAYRGFNLTTGGTAAARITFAVNPAAAAGSVVINQANPWNNLDGINLEGASYVTVQGFTVTGQPRAGIRSVTNGFVEIRNNVADANTVWGIFTGFSSDLLIENNQASRSAQQHGIYVSNSADRPMIRGNSVFENYGSGIQINADLLAGGGDGIISNAVIENNVIRANGAGGGASINLDGVQNSDIRNNVIDSARASGIALFRQDGATGSTNNRIVNNTVVVDNSLNVANGRWGVTLSGGSTGNTLRNNIIFSTQSFRGAIELAADSQAGLVSDYNVVEDRFSVDGGNTATGLSGWQTATGQDLHSISLADVTALNGLFVNRLAGDYHLAPASAAIDRGTATGAPSTDYEGQSRPSGAGYDIGADEFVTAAPPANTPPTISSVPNVTIAYNGTSGTISFTVGDAETSANALTVTVTSSDPSLLPATGLVLGGSGANRSLNITPARRKFGTATITLRVTDAGGLFTTMTFTVTVLPHRK